MSWMAAATIGSALLGARSAKQTNDQSIELANTQHQRATKDLRAAGLNPILTATKGGAGGSAPVPQLRDPVEHATKSAGTGLAAARLEQELLNLKATARKTNAEAAVTEGNIPLANIKAGVMSDVQNDLENSGLINANSAYAVGGAAGAYGASKMFKKGGKKLKSKTDKPWKNDKLNKIKNRKKRGGGGMNMPFKNPRTNIFKKF